MLQNSSPRASFDGFTKVVMTQGGIGYAREYQVERLFRVSMRSRTTPVTEQLMLSFIAGRVLGLPKSLSPADVPRRRDP
jgi:acyl-CoA dehydrogenase